MQMGPGLELALSAATKGVEEDEKKHFKEAVWYYRTAEKYFVHASKHETLGLDTIKDIILDKCKVYTKRAEKLEIKLWQEEKEVQENLYNS